jgi:hypothetical protein
MSLMEKILNVTRMNLIYKISLTFLFVIASNLFSINEESYKFKYKESEFKVNITNLNDEWNITYEISHPFFKLSQDTQFSYTNLIQVSEIKRKLIVMGGLRKIEESYKIDHVTKKIEYIKGQLTETLQYDGAIYDDLTAHLYLRLLNIQTDEEITLNVLERGKIRQKKFVKTISSPDTIKIKEKKEKDKFELFFKDNSKEILKVIQNVNGREFIWESL